MAETPALAAGASAEVSVTWDTRGRNGEHVITATADVASAVEESDETNNAAHLTVTVRGNRVENGSFEETSADGSSPAAWTGQETEAGTVNWSEGGSHGERSMTITGTGGSALVAGVSTWTSDSIEVSAGEILTLTASASVSDASSAPTIGLAYLGAGGELLDTVTLISAPLRTDGFAALEETLSVPAGVSAVRVVLAGFAPTDLGTAGSVTFDDVGLFGD